MKKEFHEGIRDGLPIGIGYFAVAFSLGIAARNAGLTAFQGFLTSLLCNASAGEYAFITQFAAHATLIEFAVMAVVTNARYVLMSCALSQKFSLTTPLYHRMLIGFDITDEVFGIEIAREGFLNPWYAYGAMLSSIPFWALGTGVGVIAGNFLPEQIVSGLSVALYGMFLAVIVPPARTNKIIAGCVLVSFAASGLAEIFLSGLSAGNRIILLTVVISAVVAILFPISDNPESEPEHAQEVHDAHQ